MFRPSSCNRMAASSRCVAFAQSRTDSSGRETRPIRHPCAARAGATPRGGGKFPSDAAEGEAVMDGMAGNHLITDEATLATLYGESSPAALTKEIDYLHPHYRAMIAASTFVVIATSGPGGLDVSPRGDPAGFVTIEDDHTLLLPDRRGNNRIDSLRNLLTDPRIALLFLIPGVGETLRVNGRAEISIDPALLARFPMQGKLPRS